MEYLAVYDWKRFFRLYCRVVAYSIIIYSKPVEAVLESLTEIYNEKAAQ